MLRKLRTQRWRLATTSLHLFMMKPGGYYFAAVSIAATSLDLRGIK